MKLSYFHLICFAIAVLVGYKKCYNRGSEDYCTTLQHQRQQVIKFKPSEQRTEMLKIIDSLWWQHCRDYQHLRK